MTTVVTIINALHHLWQVMDQGDVWQEGQAAERTQAALAQVHARLSGAQASASNYLRFVQRSAVSSAGVALAKAG